MKKMILLITCFSVFLNCSRQKKTELSIAYLNGYWQIDRVILPDGNKKDFEFNAYVDFFKTTDSVGFRSKVKPDIYGNYTYNTEILPYTLKFKNDSITITYTTDYGNFTDKLFKTSANEIGIQTSNGNLNFYKPFTPINVNNEQEQSQKQ